MSAAQNELSSHHVLSVCSKRLFLPRSLDLDLRAGSGAVSAWVFFPPPQRGEADADAGGRGSDAPASAGATSATESTGRRSHRSVAD